MSAKHHRLSRRHHDAETRFAFSAGALLEIAEGLAALDCVQLVPDDHIDRLTEKSSAAVGERDV
jgi:hypothetical protein